MSDNAHRTITLKNVLYVPEIVTNLISRKRATENGFKAIFGKQSCKITHEGVTYLEGYVNNNLYGCKIKQNVSHNVNIINECENKNCLYKWHRKLGHINVNHIKELVNNDMALGIKIDKCKHGDICETCIISKLTSDPYPKAASFRATKPT